MQEYVNQPRMDIKKLGPWLSRLLDANISASHVNPRGSKYLIFQDSGPKNPLRVWFLEKGTSNIGYLDP